MFKFWVDLWPGGNWMGLIFGGTVLESASLDIPACFSKATLTYIYIFVCVMNLLLMKLRMYNKKTLYNLH